MRSASGSEQAEIVQRACRGPQCALPEKENDMADRTRSTVLGAGFGGLELCTSLSEALGGSVEVTLIDKNASFMFGFSKLDVMFGHTTLGVVCLFFWWFLLL